MDVINIAMMITNIMACVNDEVQTDVKRITNHDDNYVLTVNIFDDIFAVFCVPVCVGHPIPQSKSIDILSTNKY